MINVKEGIRLYNAVKKIVKSYQGRDIEGLSKYLEQHCINVVSIANDGELFDINLGLINITLNKQFELNSVFEIHILDDNDTIGGYAEYNIKTGIIKIPSLYPNDNYSGLDKQKVINFLESIHIDTSKTDWEQHNKQDCEDESGTGGLWDLARTLMDELSEDELQTVLYWFLTHTK